MKKPIIITLTGALLLCGCSSKTPSSSFTNREEQGTNEIDNPNARSEQTSEEEIEIEEVKEAESITIYDKNGITIISHPLLTGSHDCQANYEVINNSGNEITVVNTSYGFNGFLYGDSGVPFAEVTVPDGKKGTLSINIDINRLDGPQIQKVLRLDLTFEVRERFTAIDAPISMFFEDSGGWTDRITLNEYPFFKNETFSIVNGGVENNTLGVFICNDSDVPLIFEVDNICINDYVIDSGRHFWSDYTVPAYNIWLLKIDLDEDFLRASGISSIDSYEFELKVTDNKAIKDNDQVFTIKWSAETELIKE